MNTFESVLKNVKEYVEVRLELFKLKSINKVSTKLSAFIAILVLSLLLILFFCILNIGIALWIGEAIGQLHFGFFIVAGFYAVVCFVLYCFRKKILKIPITNMIIKKFFH